MAKETIDLEKALLAHRAKLDIIEALAKATTEQMQYILAVDLEAFDKRLESWATAAPYHRFIAPNDSRYQQTYKRGTYP